MRWNDFITERHLVAYEAMTVAEDLWWSTVFYGLYLGIKLRAFTLPRPKVPAGCDVLFGSDYSRWRPLPEANGSTRLGDDVLDTVISTATERGLKWIALEGGPEKLLLGGVLKDAVERPNWVGLHQWTSLADLTMEYVASLATILSRRRYLSAEYLGVSGQVDCTFRRRISLKAVRRVIESVKPKVIVLNSEYLIPQRAMLLAAKECGIPCFAIQHGAIADVHRFVRKGEARASASSGGWVAPELTFVWDEVAKLRMVELEWAKAHEISVVGNPKEESFNRAFGQTDLEAAALRAGYHPDSKVILYAPRHTDPLVTQEEFVRTLEALLASAATRPNTFVLVKQHPRENRDHDRFVRSILRAYPGVAQLFRKDQPVFNAIQIASALIVRDSTVAVEGESMGLPVGVVSLGERTDQLAMVSTGRAKGLYSREALDAFVASVPTLAQVRMRKVERMAQMITGVQPSMKIVDQIFQTIARVRAEHIPQRSPSVRPQASPSTRA